MYRVEQHTADVRLRVSAASFEDLVGEAVAGLNAVLAPLGDPIGSIERRFRVESSAEATLLVDILNELLWHTHAHNEVFGSVHITRLDDFRAEILAEGGVVAGFERDVKAVTYHDLAVSRGPDGTWQTTLVVDV